MGKATTLILINLMIGIVATIVMLGVESIDPTSTLLTTNALKGDFNLIQGELNQTNDVWTNPNQYDTYLPQREATGEASTTSTQFPDWTYSSLNWISNIFGLLLNVIGAPYTLALMISNTSAGAIIGTGLSIFNLFIIVAWILGKID